MFSVSPSLVTLFAEELRSAGIVLETDEVHQLGGRLEIFIERHCERPRVGLQVGLFQTSVKVRDRVRDDLLLRRVWFRTTAGAASARGGKDYTQ